MRIATCWLCAVLVSPVVHVIPVAHASVLQPTDAYERLTARAVKEGESPSRAFDLGLGVTPSTEIISRENTKAYESLESVNARLLESLPQPLDATDEVSQENRVASVRRYAQARTRLGNNETNAAITLLEEAAALNPNSATVMARLGQVRIQIGRTQTGVAVLHQAVVLGDRSTSTLYTLARVRHDRGELDLALPLLAGAWDSVGEGTDPALIPVITAALGMALLEDGSVLAGAEAIAESLRSPTRLSSTTEYLADFGAWVRQRKRLLNRGAEAFWMVGHVQQATELYSMADDTGVFNPDDLLTRLVAAHTAGGHPAYAALAVLDSMRDLSRPVTDRQSRLLAALSSQTDLGALLDEAIESMSTRSDQLSPTIRSSLSIARAACQSERDALNTLREQASNPWASAELLRHWLGAEPNAKSVVKHALPIIASTPSQGAVIAGLVFTTRSDSGAIVERLQNSGSQESALLLAKLALAAHRPDLIEPSVQDPSSALEATVLATQTAGMGARGDWDRYATMLAQLESSRFATPVLVGEALIGGQRFGAAIEVLSDAPDTTPLLPSLLLRASVHRTLGENGQAAELLEQAVRADPTDESIHEELLEVLTIGEQDEAALGPVLRRIRTSHPSGRLIRQLMAQNLIQSRMLPQAESWLNDLLEDGAPPEQIVPLLSAIWRAQLEQSNSPDAINTPIARLRAFHAQTPGSTTIGNALAGLLAARGDTQDAIEVLTQTSEARLNPPETARLIEQLIRSDINRVSEASELAMSRLDRTTLGISESLEKAALLTMDPDCDFEGVVRMIHSALPEPAELTAPQKLELARLSSRVMSIASRSEGDAEVQSAAARFADVSISRGIKLGPIEHERRIRMLAVSSELHRVILACSQAIEQHPNLTRAVWMLGKQSLTAADRPDEALVLLTEGITRMGDPVDPNLLINALQSAGATASPGAVREMIQKFTEASLLDQIGEILNSYTTNLTGAIFPGATTARVQAELAYRLASEAMSNGRESESDAFLELAIEYDESHPWAANDLGYKIAETGENLDRAEALLTAAAEALPTHGSVLDSLGWLRYKRGTLNNDNETEGAIALLTRATEQTDGQTNATIFLHLGDAQWRVGAQDAARDAWTTARELSVQQHLFAVQNRANQRVLSVINSELESIRERLRHAEQGTPPPVAPIPGLDPEPEAETNP